jgi:hypothetical protein
MPTADRVKNLRFVKESQARKKEQKNENLPPLTQHSRQLV